MYDHWHVCGNESLLLFHFHLPDEDGPVTVAGPLELDEVAWNKKNSLEAVEVKTKDGFRGPECPQITILEV